MSRESRFCYIFFLTIKPDIECVSLVRGGVKSCMPICSMGLEYLPTLSKPNIGKYIFHTYMEIRDMKFFDLSNEKNLVIYRLIRDYTTQSYRDYDKSSK